MTVNSTDTRPRSTASESRRFIRFQFMVMAHKYSADREKPMISAYPRDLSVRSPVNFLT